PTNRLSDAVADGSFWKNSTVVSTLPISTTNITGLRAMTRGLSFTKESPIARRMIAGSNIEVAARVRTFGGRVVGSGAMVSGTVVTTGPSELSDEMLDNGAEGDDREVGEADDDHDHAGQQGGEQRPVGREGAGRCRCGLLAPERTGDGEHGNHQKESAREHRQRAHGVEPVGVP